MAINKKNIIKWSVRTLWVALGVATVFLLVSAVRKKEARTCKGIYINIEGVNNIFFVDKKDVLNAIDAVVGASAVGQPIRSFSLKTIQEQLEKNIWVNKARLYFDNNELLQVNLTEREPLARVFSTDGNTFYIDSSLSVMPVNGKFSPMLPVFTNFPTGKIDTPLLKSVLSVSKKILKDSFCMAMIDQVDITPDKTFEMVPKIGSTIVLFGDAQNAEEKFKKLKLFYTQVENKLGWNYYNKVNLQFKNQIVAKKRGAEDYAADSLRILKIMQFAAMDAERLSNDSLQRMIPDNEENTADSSLVQQSLQREEIGGPFDEALPKSIVPMMPFVNAIKKNPVVTSKPAATVVPAVTPVAPKPTVKPAAVVKSVAPKPMVKPTTVVKPVAPKPVVKPVIKPKATTIKKEEPKKETSVKPEVKKVQDMTPKNDY